MKFSLLEFIQKIKMNAFYITNMILYYISSYYLAASIILSYYLAASIILSYLII